MSTFLARFLLCWSRPRLQPLLSLLLLPFMYALFVPGDTASEDLLILKQNSYDRILFTSNFLLISNGWECMKSCTGPWGSLWDSSSTLLCTSLQLRISVPYLLVVERDALRVRMWQEARMEELLCSIGITPSVTRWLLL